MERFALKTIAALTPIGTDHGNGLGTDVLDFVMPPHLRVFTLHVYPKDDGGGGAPDDPTVEVLYGFGADWLSTNPAGGPIAAVTNKDNVITRTDQVSKVRLKFVNGATPPNKGIQVELYGSRDVAG